MTIDKILRLASEKENASWSDYTEFKKLMYEIGITDAKYFYELAETLGV